MIKIIPKWVEKWLDDYEEGKPEEWIVISKDKKEFIESGGLLAFVGDSTAEATEYYNKIIDYFYNRVAKVEGSNLEGLKKPKVKELIYVGPSGDGKFSYVFSIELK